MECEPKLDYGRTRILWEYDGDGYGTAVGRADEGDLELRLTTDLRLGFEGGRARARTTLHDGDTAFVALSWSEHAPPVELRRGLPPARLHRRLLARVAQPRRLPRPPVARRTCSAAP